jgi:glutamate---cysteine ligase / carboxylate-amine ligase
MMLTRKESEVALGTPGFGRIESLQIGVEEEHLLVDPTGGGLVDQIEEVIRAGRPGAGALEPDTFSACLELVTPVCRDIVDAAPTLRSLRRAAAETGATLMGAGLHPTASWGEAVHVPEPRYDWLAGHLRGLLTRTPTCALHVHVGMPDEETAIKVCDGMRARLPLLIALAANSPFAEGRDTGFASARWAVWRAYPRTGPPPAFGSYAGYHSAVREILDAGELDDFTLLWWDIRPNPRLGTIEVRVMDVQSDLEHTIGLVSFVHALVLAEVARPFHPHLPDIHQGALGEACFHAARDGMASYLPDGEGGLVSATILAQREIERILPVVKEWEFVEALEPLRRLIADGGGAARQRRDHDDGGVDAVVAGLLARTAFLGRSDEELWATKVLD